MDNEREGGKGRGIEVDEEKRQKSRKRRKNNNIAEEIKKSV